MSKRVLITLVFILFCTSLYATEDETILEIKRLQATVTAINLELKSNLDQVLMLQEAVKINSKVSLELQGRSPDALSFDDLASAKRLAIQRETSINARLDEILLRSNELDVKKQVLLNRVMELNLAPRASVAKSAK
jgi:hypothetical protein